MRSVPVRVKTQLCELDYTVPIEGSVLELTIPEFQNMLSVTHDVATRLTLTLESVVQYPQLVDVVLPAVKALSEIVADEMMKHDQEEAVALRDALSQIQQFYQHPDDDDLINE